MLDLKIFSSAVVIETGAARLCSVVTFVFATIPEPASKLSIYGCREVHESETQNEVAKALRGREKEGLVTIPNNFILLHLDEGKYNWQNNNSHKLNIIDDTRAPG